MEPEVLEQEEVNYQNPRRAFVNQVKRKGEEVFKETFDREINFDEVEEEFSNIDALEEIASTEVTKPNFPFITFFVALVLDVLDFADFTGVGWLIMSAVEIVFSIILFFLMFGKLNTMFKMSSQAVFRGRSRKRLGRRRRNTGGIGGGIQKLAKKYLQKYMSRRLIATLIINIIPIIGILASNAFFVVLAHNKQKKIAQKYMVLVEKVSDILKDFDKNS